MSLDDAVARVGPEALRGVIGPVQRSRRAPNPFPSIGFRGLDGTHSGVAVTLWRAAYREDAAETELVVQTIPAAEALHSSLDLLLSIVAWIGVKARDQFAGAASLESLAASGMLSEQQSRLCREVAFDVRADPETDRVRVSLLPVVDVIRVVLVLSELIRAKFGVAVGDQISAYVSHVEAAASERT